jgi:hypothetical protein
MKRLRLSRDTKPPRGKSSCHIAFLRRMPLLARRHYGQQTVLFADLVDEPLLATFQGHASSNGVIDSSVTVWAAVRSGESAAEDSQPLQPSPNFAQGNWIANEALLI